MSPVSEYHAGRTTARVHDSGCEGARVRRRDGWYLQATKVRQSALNFRTIAPSAAPTVAPSHPRTLAPALVVNAIDVVHSGVSGNNGGYQANPSSLEDLPN